MAETKKVSDDQRLLTRADVADRTGLSRDQVRRLTESGKLPSRKVGRRVMVTPAGLDRWLTSADYDDYVKGQPSVGVAS